MVLSSVPVIVRTSNDTRLACFFLSFNSIRPVSEKVTKILIITDILITENLFLYVNSFNVPGYLSTLTGEGLDDWGSYTRVNASRPVLKPTEPPIQWVLWV